MDPPMDVMRVRVTTWIHDIQVFQNKKIKITLDELDGLDKTYGVMVVAVGKCSKHAKSVLPFAEIIFVQFMNNFEKNLILDIGVFPNGSEIQ